MVTNILYALAGWAVLILICLLFVYVANQRKKKASKLALLYKEESDILLRGLPDEQWLSVMTLLMHGYKLVPRMDYPDWKKAEPRVRLRRDVIQIARQRDTLVNRDGSCVDDLAHIHKDGAAYVLYWREIQTTDTIPGDVVHRYHNSVRWNHWLKQSLHLILKEMKAGSVSTKVQKFSDLPAHLQRVLSQTTGVCAHTQLLVFAALLERCLEDTRAASKIEEDQKEDFYECDSCGSKMRREECRPAKDLFQRLSPGGIYTDMECPKCGALTYPKTQ